MENPFSHASAAIAAIFLLAGAVKGVSGMGLPTVAMGLLGLWMPPPAAAALLVLPSLLTNVAQCLGPDGPALWRRLWPLWLTMVLATLASPLPDLGSAGAAARLTLGAVLVVYGGWGLMRPSLPQPGRHERWLAPVAGLGTGLLTAATGVFVVPVVPFLQALRLPREPLVQALGITFALTTLSLAARLWWSGQWSGAAAADWRVQALALLSALMGMGAGARLRRHLAGPRFSAVLFGMFVVLGALMLARGG